MSDPFQLATGQDVAQSISLASIAVALDTVKVAGRNACLARGDTVVATYAIWEQVRAALAAAQLTTRNKDLSASIMTYDRTLDPTFPRVRRQSTSFGTVLSGRPWRSTTADSLRRFGYVVPDLLGGKVFYAPDLDVLLSTGFLEDHCFRLARASNSTRIGLEFEPTRDRSEVVDIRGTAWLDRASAELRSVDFRYDNLSVVESDARPGGQMEFVRVKNGLWAIARWNIRMPAIAEFNERAGSKSGVTMKVQRVSEIKVAGGELIAVTGIDDTLWARPPTVLSGTVVDSASKHEITGARLSLRGTQLNATTDKSGRFSIAGILPGEYAVDVRTPSLDSVDGTYATSVAFTDAATKPRLLVPDANRVASEYCSAKSGPPTGLAFGVVTMKGDSTPPWNALVVAEWKAGGPRSADARTDAGGRYRICGIPVNTQFTLRTELDDTATVPRPIEFARRARFVRTDIVIERPAAATGTLFAGAVSQQWTNEPLADVEIVIPELGLSARTNERGRFRLTGIPPGSFTVAVRKIGYGAVETTMTFATDRATSRQFQLGRVVALDTVNVTADRRIADFEANRRLGLGHFLTRAELEKLEGVRFQDVLRQVPGIGISTGFGSHAWVVQGYRGIRVSRSVPLDSFDTFRGAKPGLCYAQVYVDGLLMFANRPPAGGALGIPQPLFDLSDIDVSRIEAVEYYASELTVPARYMSAFATCGVLVIHTRRSGK
jgi:hypothetical protein